MNSSIIKNGVVTLALQKNILPLMDVYTNNMYTNNVVPGKWFFYKNKNMIMANNKEYNIKTYKTINYTPMKFFCDKISIRFNYNTNENKEIFLFHNKYDEYYEISYGIYHDNLLSHIKIVRKSDFYKSPYYYKFDYNFTF